MKRERVVSHFAQSIAGYTATFESAARRCRAFHCLSTLLAVLLAVFLCAPLAAQGNNVPRNLIFEPVALPEQQALPLVPVSANGLDDGIGRAPGGGETGREDAARYRQQLDTLLSEEGLYSQGRREQFEALGIVLQQLGEHDEALQAFAEALHIERVNNGLYSLAQLPLVDRIIESHAALNNFPEVNDHHAYRFYVEQRSYPENDPRLLAAKEAWADRNVESYLTQAQARSFFSFTTGVAGMSDRTDYVAIQNPYTGGYQYVPRNQLPLLMSSRIENSRDLYQSTAPYAVNAELVVDERLRTASRLYEEIQTAKGEEADPALVRKRANVDIAVKRMFEEIDTRSDSRSIFASRVSQRRTPPHVVTRSYARNRDALAEAVENTAQDPDSTPTQHALTLLDLGDWQLSFGYPGRANEAYLSAWTVLRDSGLDQSAISDILAPAPLVPVPAFASHPYTRERNGIPEDAELEYKGYIDLSMTLTRAGRLRGTRIDAVSEGTSQLLRSALLDYLREQTMRPVLVEGIPVETPMQIRYYYTY